MKATLHTPAGTLALDVPAEALWSPQSAARALREAGAPPAFVGALGRPLAAAAMRIVTALACLCPGGRNHMRTA